MEYYKLIANIGVTMSRDNHNNRIQIHLEDFMEVKLNTEHVHHYIYMTSDY